ncbi:LysR family transcriptional regulator [Sphingosinicellaceae bacterium]|nr:LysR family transcriptional regulator [Sphingosinicellaceae bacterium]
MEMHQIRYFLAVARTLNFTRAAEESNVTQPSLTRAIQKLEDEFGGLLFRRERSLTHLTDMGRQMLPHLERTLAAAHAAKSLARGIGKAAVAPLNLGLDSALARSEIGEALAEVGAGLPGFQLRIASDDSEGLLQELLKGDLDMVVVVEPRVMHDRFDTIELFAQAYAVVAPDTHALATAATLSLADLHDVVWVRSSGDHLDEFRDICAAAGVDPDYRHETATDADAVRLVAARLGCAIVAVGVMPPGVTVVVIEGLALTRRVVIATVSGRQRPPAGDALLRAMRARAWN